MSKIITFEGIDGSGKTTLRNAVAKHYAAKGEIVWATSEPWKIDKRLDSNPFVATMQLMADRWHHCNALKSTLYDIALIDRFDLSTEAYQGYGDGVDLGLINTLNAVATEGIYVSLRIWLDLPVDVAIRRIESRGESLTPAEIERLERVRYGYARILSMRQLRRIDATQPPDDVLREAIALIEEVL